MSEHPEMPTLNFFRATPGDLLEQPPLASSLQSLETTFFLIALGRYPSALATCATAWESAIKAKLAITPENRIDLWRLERDIRDVTSALKEYDESKTRKFRDARNRIVHYGFSPKDDPECGRLLVETGLPFLCSLYRELFDFYVNWHDLRPELKDFMQLNDIERAKAGLLPDVADQLQIADAVFKLNSNRTDFNPLFCFTAFSHYVRVRMKDAHKSNVEDRLIEEAEATGIRYDVEEAEKDQLKRKIDGETWEFDCPICDGIQSVVAELDAESLKSGQVNLNRCMCVSCHLFIPKYAYHLADLLFERELEEQVPLILGEYK